MNPDLRMTSKQNKNKISSLQNIEISQKTFMKYYEENIKLKRQMEQKNLQIKQLKQKIQKQYNLNKTVINPKQQLNLLKEEVKKNVNKQNNIAKKTFSSGIGYGGSTQSKKVQNLLQIIEHYKQKLQLAQQQSAHLRRKNTLLEQDISLKDRKVNNIQQFESNRRQPDITKQQQLSQKLKQKIYECESQKQRNKYYQAEMKRLQVKLRTLQTGEDQIHDLKVENRRLEEKIRNLTSIYKSNDTIDIRSVQEKVRELELKLKTGMEKYDKLKEEHMKMNAEKKLLTEQLIIKSSQNQQNFKQLTELKKSKINNPIIKKLLQNEHLLAKVIGEIEADKISNQNYSQFIKPQASYQKIVLEKQQLAKQLIETQTRIKAIQESWREKQTLMRIEKEEMMSKLSSIPDRNKDKKSYTSKSGVPYDGDIIMFTDQMINIASGVNYFDLFLSDINLLETMIQSVTNLTNVSNLMILATVDFYNFNTVKSKLIQGIQSNLHSEFTFKILEDEFFFKYMNKESFKVDIWASEGNKHIHIGRLEIPLKPLYLNNKDGIAPVVNTSAPVFLNNKVMGTIQYDMRMRLPIYDQISKILDISKNLPQNDEVPLRKLIIQIEQGSGFSDKSNLFVYYSFRMQDFYTKTSKGPKPNWNHSKLHDIRYNNDSKNYLRKNQIEFTLFDDNAVLYDDKDTDVIGSGSLPLVSLIEDKPIRERLEIRKKGIKVGSIDVKIFWYENKQKVSNVELKKQEDFIKALHNDLLKHLKDKNSSPETEFRLIDINRTGMMSWDEFFSWVNSSRIKKSHNYSHALIKKYYNTFKQPLNLLNWMTKLSHQYEEKKQDDLSVKWDALKQVIYQNSIQLKKQISLEEYLKEKDLFNMSLQIDKNGNGKISKQEIVKYMKDHNITIPLEQIPNQVTIVQFLKKYQKMVQRR